LLLRGVFDAGMSVYLDRFLNVPAVKLPTPSTADDPDALLAELPAMLDQQQQVSEAAGLVAAYLAGGGDPAKSCRRSAACSCARTATSTRFRP